MDTLNSMFSNREISLLIWFFIFSVWAFSRTEVRKSIGVVVRGFFAKPIVTAVMLMLLYVIGMVVLFSSIGLWTPLHIKDTTVWFLGTAFVMLMNINSAKNDEDYFKKVILDNAKFILIFEFLVNFYVFDLWIEIILIPVLVFLGLLQVIAGTKTEFKSIKVFFDSMIAIIGIGLLIHVIYSAVLNFADLTTLDTIQAFLLGPVFTISLLPFVYMVALYAAYEQVYVRMRFLTSDAKLVRYTMWKAFFTFHVNLKKLNRWSKKTGTLRIRDKEDVQALLTKSS